MTDDPAPFPYHHESNFDNYETIWDNGKFVIDLASDKRGNGNWLNISLLAPARHGSKMWMTVTDSDKTKDEFLAEVNDLITVLEYVKIVVEGKLPEDKS